MLSTGPPASEPAAPYPSLRESADAASDDRRQSARMQMPAEDLGRRLIHSSSDVNGEMVAPHRCRNGLIDLHHPQSFVPFDLHNLPALAFNAAATNRVLSGGALMEPRTSYRAWWLRDDKRKQSVPWTEEEHRSFLHGMQKYGSGAWGKISKEFVKTRTPSQLASHAQKFRIRQSKAAEERRRSSILDITKD
ncbi:unnamed protein product [Spirodela intermedia]|nr:unnamed protein product [Spirodela intermedia]CAA7397011.1 unnamed protein product [Spirodela intermedia]